jgi:hypothetical protein
MKKPQLQHTKDLSVFVHHQHQQPMAASHVRRVALSMAKHGYWSSKPIGCVRNGSKLTVIDGHHRLAAAQQLGIGVYCVVEEPGRADDIGDENYIVRTWSNTSFAKMYAKRGNPHYIELIRYAEDFSIPMSTAASLLRGEAGHSGNAGVFVRAGTFKVKTRDSMKMVVSFIQGLGVACPVIKTKVFIDALSILLFVEEFDAHTLYRRMETNPLLLVKCSDRDQMLQQIEEVYNFRTREKVPLAFLAKEKMKERNLANTKPKSA